MWRGESHEEEFRFCVGVPAAVRGRGRVRGRRLRRHRGCCQGGCLEGAHERRGKFGDRGGHGRRQDSLLGVLRRGGSRDGASGGERDALQHRLHQQDVRRGGDPYAGGRRQAVAGRPGGKAPPRVRHARRTIQGHNSTDAFQPLLRTPRLDLPVRVRARVRPARASAGGSARLRPEALARRHGHLLQRRLHARGDDRREALGEEVRRLRRGAHLRAAGDEAQRCERGRDGRGRGGLLRHPDRQKVPSRDSAGAWGGGTLLHRRGFVPLRGQLHARWKAYPERRRPRRGPEEPANRLHKAPARRADAGRLRVGLRMDPGVPRQGRPGARQERRYDVLLHEPAGRTGGADRRGDEHHRQHRRPGDHPRHTGRPDEGEGAAVPGQTRP